MAQLHFVDLRAAFAALYGESSAGRVEGSDRLLIQTVAPVSAFALLWAASSTCLSRRTHVLPVLALIGMMSSY